MRGKSCYHVGVNKPLHPIAGGSARSPAYEADSYGWALAQARLIRERRYDAIDWGNVAEEIESVGRSELAAAESALRGLMAHILKWSMQPHLRGRSWTLTILEQRLRFDHLMAVNPGLKPHLEEMRNHSFRRARIEAAREMDVDLKTIADEPPSWPTILDEPFDLGS